jgi:hypothetical protein
MVLEAYVFNLFNQEAVTNITPRYNRNGSIPQALTADLYAGTLGDATQYVAGLSPTLSPSYNPIYRLPLGYQEARQIRVGVRFQF